MAVDRTKILEAAQKHLSKGVFDKAIIELQKLVKADPSDVRTWLKIGDLYVKLNQRPQAIDTYARVADQYAQQGFLHKAVAVYKQILNLDGTRLDVKLKLAEMHESMQLTSEAMATYEQVAAEYGRLGDADRALATFGKMCELDPSNIPTRIKYAEALSRAGRNEEAAAAFEVGAGLLKSQGRMDDYLKVVERLLFHREDVERARELAELYLERNDGKRALAKLQVLFKSDPKHIPTLELLARAFEQVQQLPKTVSVLREIARLHGEQGNVDERARALKRIVALDPGDPEARQALAQMAGPARAPAPAVRRDLAPPPGALIGSARREAVSEPPEELEPEVEAVDEVDDIVEGDDVGDVGDEETAFVDEDDGGSTEGDGAEEPAGDSSDVFIVEEDPIEEAAAAPVEDEPAPPEPAAPPPRTSLPPDVAREANIAKLMTEVEVFLRYGLKQKVVEQLRHVLSIEPRHVEAREKLKDVLVERGEGGAAAVELVALADHYVREKPAVSLMYLRQARDLDPSNFEVLGRLEALEPPPPSVHPRPQPEAVPEAMPTPVPAAPSESVALATDPGFVEDRTMIGEPVADPEPSPPTRPQPVTSYLAARGPKPAGQTGGHAAMPAGQTGGHAAQPGPAKPGLLGAKPAATPAGRAGLPARPLAGALKAPISAPRSLGTPGAKPGIAAPARSLGRPSFGTPLGKAPGEPPSSTSIALPEAQQKQPTYAEAAPPPSAELLVPDAVEASPSASSEASPSLHSEPRSEPSTEQRLESQETPFFVDESDDPTSLAPAVEAAASEAEPGDTAPEREPIVPSAAPIAAELAESSDPLDPISPEEFESAPLRPSVVEELAPGRTSLPPGEVEEILDEAEFFVAQGLFDEGIGVLRDAVAAHPKNRLLLDKIAEIEEQAARASAAMRDASQPPPPVDNSFELASKLADELGGSSSREGSDVLDVEEVFAQFKKGVEAQVSVDDTDTHFDLGIAYKEMGLIPDAIKEFELCTVNPSRECMAHTMVGLCHLEKNDVPAAIGAFKKGLYAEKKTEREELGLYFELGRAYEAMHDAQEALYYYEKVKKRDATFLKVQDRIDALTKPQRPKATEPAAAGGEDLDAAFDELMGKE